MIPETLLAPRSLVVFGALALLGVACDNNKKNGAALVPDAAAITPTVASADAGVVDVNQCAPCQAAPTPSAWTFEGVYRDAACTEPLAQAVVPACGSVPAMGPGTVTYVDEVGLRKANEAAPGAKLVEQVAAEMPRFRKAGKACVRANEGAVDVAPASCSQQRVCRDQNGALGCGTCRTFTNGCPDFEETRVYATIDDPGLKAAKTAAAGGNLARLAQCCAALAAEAKRLGPSPEAGMLATAAAQCSAIAASGNAPEVGALKAILAGRNLPAICAGF